MSWPRPWRRNPLSTATRRGHTRRAGGRFSKPLEQRLVLTIVWTGAAGDDSFQNPNNWNLNRTPTSGDDVAINATGITINSTASVSIRSIQSQAALNIESGTFSVNGGTSNINAALTVAGGATLSADATGGTGTTLTVSGATVVDDANLYATNGATLSLPGVTSYGGGGGNVLEANGTGSALSLANLTSLSGGSEPGFSTVPSVSVDALAGGSVAFPALTQIQGTPVDLEADGTNSVLNLSALVSCTVNGGIPQAGRTGGSFQATNGGTIKDGHLTSVNAYAVNLDGTGTFSYAQITSFTSSGITIPTGTFNFSSLTDADGSGFTVNSGATLNLPVATSANNAGFTVNGGALSLPDLASANGTSFVVSGGASVTVSGITSYVGAGTLKATGTGSALAFPNLTSLSGGSEPGFSTVPSVSVDALAGGSVAFPALTQIQGTPVDLEADGANSVLNLSALVSCTVNGGIPQAGRTSGSLQATNGGTINDGQLTSVDSYAVILDGTGTFAYAQITSFTSSSITIPSGTFNFSSLTEADGSGFTIGSGSTLNLPVATKREWRKLHRERRRAEPARPDERQLLQLRRQWRQLGQRERNHELCGQRDARSHRKE